MVGGLRLAGGRHGFIEPAAGHRAGAVQQVADGVGQVVVDQIAEPLLLKVAFLAEGDVPQEVPTDRVTAAALEQLGGVQDVAQGLAHLLAFPGQEAVAKDLGGKGQARREQHGGPVDGMETEDVLADDMDRRRPAPAQGCVEVGCVTLFEQRGDVAEQRIKPDIKGVTVVAGNGDAPGQVDP